MPQPVTTTTDPGTIFAVDLAALAREIAQDIFPVGDILRLHQLTEDEWARICAMPHFQSMLNQMILDWNKADSTRDRIRVKAATGLESQLEDLIRDLGDKSIPYTQRVEGAKFLARIGEVDGTNVIGSAGGAGVQININFGQPNPLSINAVPKPVIDLDALPVIPESR